MGFNAYLCCLVLCIFDTAEPALKRVNIKKRTAILYCIAVLAFSFLEDIFILDSFSISLAGFALPMLLCCKLAANISAADASRALLYAMISSAGCWALMQIFMQSTELLNFDLSWLRGMATVLFTLMFTSNPSLAIISAYISFYLSGYWVHMDMLISGLPNYWAAGSGAELAVSAFMAVTILGACQLMVYTKCKAKKVSRRLAVQRAKTG